MCRARTQPLRNKLEKIHIPQPLRLRALSVSWGRLYSTRQVYQHINPWTNKKDFNTLRASPLNSFVSKAETNWMNKKNPEVSGSSKRWNQLWSQLIANHHRSPRLLIEHIYISESWLRQWVLVSFQSLTKASCDANLSLCQPCRLHLRGHSRLPSLQKRLFRL